MMVMNKKRWIILICTICAIIICVVFGSRFIKITDQQYNDEATKFNKIYDSMADDYYEQCELVLNGEKTTKNFFELYDDKSRELNKVFEKYKESQIPKDKLQDFKDKKKIADLMSTLIDDITPFGGTKKEYAQEFVNYAEKRYKKLGKLDTVKGTIANDGKSDLQVISKKDIHNGDDYYITGEVKNNTNEVKNNVYIEINLYDKNNTLLGQAIDKTDMLDANGIWKFKAEILDKYKDELSSYRVVELTSD